MNKYEQLINKIWKIKISKELKDNPYPDYNVGILSQTELMIIADALVTFQFLEIIFKAKKENHETP